MPEFVILGDTTPDLDGSMYQQPWGRRLKRPQGEALRGMSRGREMVGPGGEPAQAGHFRVPMIGETCLG
jgi:hypothetical protein